MSQAGDVDVKEDISISDNEVGIRPVINEEVDIVKNIESFDYNCCCYCTDEFPSAEIRDKHEFHCPMGPQLTVRLLIANLNESKGRSQPELQWEKERGEPTISARKSLTTVRHLTNTKGKHDNKSNLK